MTLCFKNIFELKKKYYYFLFFIKFFLCFKLFSCADVKNIFFKIKKNYFDVFLNKKTLLRTICTLLPSIDDIWWDLMKMIVYSYHASSSVSSTIIPLKYSLESRQEHVFHYCYKLPRIINIISFIGWEWILFLKNIFYKSRRVSKILSVSDSYKEYTL